ANPDVAELVRLVVVLDDGVEREHVERLLRPMDERAIRVRYAKRFAASRPLGVEDACEKALPPVLRRVERKADDISDGFERTARARTDRPHLAIVSDGRLEDAFACGD